MIQHGCQYTLQLERYTNSTKQRVPIHPNCPIIVIQHRTLTAYVCCQTSNPQGKASPLWLVDLARRHQYTQMKSLNCRGPNGGGEANEMGEDSDEKTERSGSFVYNEQSECEGC